MISIRFTLEDDALLVANTGKGFSRRGVISVCHMDLSDKDPNENFTPEDEYKEYDDRTLVCGISKKCLKGYENSINDLKEDVKHEKGVQKSYAGRFVWELLQNADDAADTGHTNSQLIGTKGLGFKSVLEITEEPEIYSGEFCFHFSREKSREMLSDVDKWNELKGIPVCRLPHRKEPDAAVKNLFAEGYVTVIRLPLKEGKRESVENKLAEFCGSFLLFCQRIETVEIQANSTTRRITVRRLQKKEIELTENGISKYWHIWHQTKEIAGEKQISVSVCLPVVDKDIRPCEEVPPLSVFFPTAESVPGVHALLHASCEVDDNRQHLGIEQPHCKEICEILKNITETILSEIPAGVALGAFGRAEKDAQDGMAAQLGNAIAETVRETAFVPVIDGGTAKPGDVRLWRYEIGRVANPDKVEGKNLCDPEINDDRCNADILKDLGARDVSDPELAELLCLCRNATEADCLAAWNVAQSLMSETVEEEKCAVALALRKAPFWRTGNGQARAIDGDVPLVEKQPKNCPAWLPVDVIDKGFLKLLTDEEKRRKEDDQNWENSLSGNKVSPSASTAEYFDDILLPYCEKQSQDEWRQNGWEICQMAFAWGRKGSGDEPLIVDFGDAKEKRAQIFRLPVGKGARNWVPALQCYAGKVWGGPKIFDDYFKKIDNRDILAPPDDWKIDITDADKKQWKNLLSWLGCSWMPKLVQHPDWHPNNKYYYCTRHDFDFYFEHFDEMFSDTQNNKPSKCVPLLSMVREMYEVADKKRARLFHYNYQYKDSYASRQLRDNRWIPCKRSLLYPNNRLFAPKEAYLPGCGLGGLLPEIDKGDLDDQAWDEIEETLKKLGAKDSISNNPNELVKYMNQLSECADQNATTLKWIEGKNKGKGKICGKSNFFRICKNRRMPIS